MADFKSGEFVNDKLKDISERFSYSNDIHIEDWRNVFFHQIVFHFHLTHQIWAMSFRWKCPFDFEFQ